MKRLPAFFCAALLFSACAWMGRSPKECPSLTFSTFKGSGTVFRIVLDEDIVSYDSREDRGPFRQRGEKGAPYSVTYTFRGLRPGETVMTVQKRSGIDGNTDRNYSVRVDASLNVQLTLLKVTDLGRHP